MHYSTQTSLVEARILGNRQPYQEMLAEIEIGMIVLLQDKYLVCAIIFADLCRYTGCRALEDTLSLTF